MPDLKLPKIPERTPVKMAFMMPPELASALQDYALVYEKEYGRAEDVQALIPYMLANFLENDRAFQLVRRTLTPSGQADKKPKVNP